MRQTLLGILLLTITAILGQSQRPPDDWRYDNDNRNWDRGWNNRPFPRAGACFFTNANFGGNRFCVRRGDRLDRLPGNFGDNISSIETFGNASVIVFNDRNFTGGSEQIRGNVRDLRNRRFRGGHTWNNRISSIVVR